MKYLLAILASLLLPTRALAAYDRDCVIRTLTLDAKTRGYEVSFGATPEGTIGVTTWLKKVVVTDRLDPDTQVHILLHEIGHVQLKHQEKGAGSRISHESKEWEAETAAGIALGILGLSPGSYTSAEYLLWHFPTAKSSRVAQTILVGNTMASTVMSYCKPT
jgi:hypothetical protein